MKELTFEQLPQAVTQLYDKLTNIERLLQEKSNDPINEADQLLTIQQAAEILSLSVPTIYGLVSRSEVPCMKKGKRLYFSRQELMNWIKTGRKMTTAETEAKAQEYTQRKRK